MNKNHNVELLCVILGAVIATFGKKIIMDVSGKSFTRVMDSALYVLLYIIGYAVTYFFIKKVLKK